MRAGSVGALVILKLDSDTVVNFRRDVFEWDGVRITELLESAFRTVAGHDGVDIGDDRRRYEMFKAVRDVLVVVPPGVTDPEKADALLRRPRGNVSVYADTGGSCETPTIRPWQS